MRNPRLHSLLCSLAGPAVNLLLVGLALLVVAFARPRSGIFFVGTGPVADWPYVAMAAYAVGYVNVILSVFNLIPIPPLDGSAVVERLMPKSWWPNWLKFRQYGMGVLFMLVLVTPQLFANILDPFLSLYNRVARG
jgi:Zn-dependent protease